MTLGRANLRETVSLLSCFWAVNHSDTRSACRRLRDRDHPALDIQFRAFGWHAASFSVLRPHTGPLLRPRAHAARPAKDEGDGETKVLALRCFLQESLRAVRQEIGEKRQTGMSGYANRRLLSAFAQPLNSSSTITLLVFTHLARCCHSLGSQRLKITTSRNPC